MEDLKWKTEFRPDPFSSISMILVRSLTAVDLLLHSLYHKVKIIKI